MFDRRDSSSTETETWTHLSAQDLARVASGGSTRSEEDRHLASCRECLTAYAELVRCRAETDLRANEAPPEILHLGQVTMDRLMTAEAQVEHTPENMPIPGARPRRVWAFVPGVAAAAVLLFLVMRGPAPSVLPEAELLEPVRTALISQSAHGLVNPLVADENLDAAPVLRGGTVQPLNTGGGGLRESIAQLRRHYQENPESSALAVWLVSALQADGQLRSARGYLELAVRKHPQDADLRMLEIVQEYREGNSAGAESALRARVEAHPNDELARRNLAKLLAEIS